MQGPIDVVASSLPQFPHQGGRPETPPISHSLTEHAHRGQGSGRAEHPAPCSTPGVPRYCFWPMLVPLNQGQSDLNSESERLPGLIREYLQPLCSQLDSQVTAAAGDPDTGVKVAGGGAGGGRGAATSWGQQLDTAWPERHTRWQWGPRCRGCGGSGPCLQLGHCRAPSPASGCSQFSPVQGTPAQCDAAPPAEPAQGAPSPSQ